MSFRIKSCQQKNDDRRKCKIAPSDFTFENYIYKIKAACILENENILEIYEILVKILVVNNTDIFLWIPSVIFSVL